MWSYCFLLCHSIPCLHKTCIERIVVVENRYVLLAQWLTWLNWTLCIYSELKIWQVKDPTCSQGCSVAKFAM